MVESEGRLQAVLQGLKAGTVQVMTFQEPTTSALLESNMVSTLYDLKQQGSDDQGTWRRVSGPKSAHIACIHRSASRHRAAPRQRVGESNAFREQSYGGRNRRKAAAGLLRQEGSVGPDQVHPRHAPNLCKGDYSFSPAAVKLVVDAIQASAFDSSPEGSGEQRVRIPR